MNNGILEQNNSDIPVDIYITNRSMQWMLYLYFNHGFDDVLLIVRFFVIMLNLPMFVKYRLPSINALLMYYVVRSRAEGF